MTAANDNAPKKFSPEWYRSDAAYEHRCAKYLGEMLRKYPAARKQEATFVPGSEPEWPAFWVYDPDLDSPMWIECDRPFQLRDYHRAFPDQLNKAALALIDG